MKQTARGLILIAAVAITMCSFSGCNDHPTQTQTVATPVLSPEGGFFTETLTLTISCATDGAVIRYTTDGSEPSQSSSQYSGPLVLDSTTTLKARGFKQGWNPSPIASAAYLITLSVATPEISPESGQFSEMQRVAINCATEGAVIRYTTDGTDPTETSALYSSRIDIYRSTTVKAKGFRADLAPSAVAIASYTISYAPIPLLYVSGGNLNMGETTGSYYVNEHPVHSVTLNPFSIGQYEVTQSEYACLMGSNPASDYGVGDNYPVYNVSWYSAIKYCNLRSMVEDLEPVYSINGSTDPADWGRVPTSADAVWNAVSCNWNSTGYRLPTEAEWEYAARGATNDPDYLYSGSDDVMSVGWYVGNNTSAGYPTGAKPVGLKIPNGVDAYDMTGNVMEWCWDWYSSSYYSVSPHNNPTGPASGGVRGLRNVGWNGYLGGCRISYRHGSDPFYVGYNTGFRLCRTER